MPTWLKNLQIHRVASVDRGAGEGVKVLLTKRDEPLSAEAEAYLKREFSEDQRKELAASGAAMPDGSYPIENKADLENAIRAFGRANDPDKTKAHIKARAKALGAEDVLPDEWVKKADTVAALATLKGLLAKAFPADKNPDVLKLLDQIEKEFKEAESFGDIMDDQLSDQALWQATEALRCSIDSIMDDPSVTEKEPPLRATMAEFTQYVIGLAAGVDPSKIGKTGDQETDDMDALKKSLGLDASATEAQVLAAITALKADVEKAKSLSDKHQAYADAKGMSGKALDDFKAMSADERDDHISKNPVEKRDDGMATELAKRDARIAELEKRDQLHSITKRVEPLIHVGKAAEVAELLYGISKFDRGLADQVEKTFATLNEQVEKGGLFEERGSGQRGSVAKAFDAINAKAADLQKANPGWSIAKARTEARRLNPDLAKQERDEQRA